MALLVRGLWLWELEPPVLEPPVLEPLVLELPVLEREQGLLEQLLGQAEKMNWNCWQHFHNKDLTPAKAGTRMVGIVDGQKFLSGGKLQTQ